MEQAKTGRMECWNDGRMEKLKNDGMDCFPFVHSSFFYSPVPLFFCPTQYSSIPVLQSFPPLYPCSIQNNLITIRRNTYFRIGKTTYRQEHGRMGRQKTGRLEQPKNDGIVKSRHSGGNRSPDVVPAKAGSHSRDWIPVFTGNPGFRRLPRTRSGVRRNDGNTSFQIFSRSSVFHSCIFPIFQYSILPLFQCPVPFFQFSILPVVRSFRLSIIPIFQSSNLPVSHSSILPIFHYSVFLFGSQVRGDVDFSLPDFFNGGEEFRIRFFL